MIAAGKSVGESWWRTTAALRRRYLIVRTDEGFQLTARGISVMQNPRIKGISR